MKYLTPPEGHRWHKPKDSIPDPPEGWRFCLEAEVRRVQNWLEKKIPCKAWNRDCGWNVPADYAGNFDSLAYIVPDTTPFDIPFPSVSGNPQSHAFPSVEYTQEGLPVPGSQQIGLTKREYAAIEMLKGILSRPDDSTYTTPNVWTVEEWKAHHRQCDAAEAVQMADALLAELNKKEGA